MDAALLWNNARERETQRSVACIQERMLTEFGLYAAIRGIGRRHASHHRDRDSLRQRVAELEASNKRLVDMLWDGAANVAPSLPISGI